MAFQKACYDILSSPLPPPRRADCHNQHHPENANLALLLVMRKGRAYRSRLELKPANAVVKVSVKIILETISARITRYDTDVHFVAKNSQKVFDLETPRRVYPRSPKQVDMPARILTEKSATSSCPVCASSSHNIAPDSQPPCPHRFQECWQKPDRERTFYRHDTFMQHLRSVHFRQLENIHDRKIRDYIDTSKCSDPIHADTYDLVCHFCSISCRDWSERAQHIAKHFKNGETISLWIPGGLYVLAPDGSTSNESYDQRCLLKSLGRTPNLWICKLNLGSLNDGWELPVEGMCSLCGIAARFIRSGDTVMLEAMRSHTVRIHWSINAPQTIGDSPTLMTMSNT